MLVILCFVLIGLVTRVLFGGLGLFFRVIELVGIFWSSVRAVYVLCCLGYCTGFGFSVGGC